jgi:CubicO group peptidase (beta-lactamase class C family)
MILSGGVYRGKRILSERSVRDMTTRQTLDSIRSKYGLGMDITDSTYGHGAAYSSNFTISPAHGLIMIYLAQHAGFLGNGGQAVTAFRSAAVQAFGRSPKR